MLKMSGFDVLFAATGNLYWLLALAGICAAFWLGKTRTRKLVYAASDGNKSVRPGPRNSSINGVGMHRSLVPPFIGLRTEASSQETAPGRRCMRLRLKILTTACVGSAVSAPVWAAAPVYFDLGGLIYGTLLYVVALVVTCKIAISRRSWLMFGVFMAVLLSPVGLFWSARPKEGTQALAKETDARQAEAYRQFCSQAKFRGSAAAPAEGMSLLFSRDVEPSPGGGTSSDLAVRTARMLVDRNLCASTGIRYIEARRYVQGETHRFDRYELACPRVEHTVVDAPDAAFGLVFSEESETVVAPGKVPWGRTDLTSHSVRIVDLRNEATLASDVVYETSFASAVVVAACPDRYEAIAAFIVKILPHR